MNDSWSKWSTREGIQQPPRDARGRRRRRRRCLALPRLPGSRHRDALRHRRVVVDPEVRPDGRVRLREVVDGRTRNSSIAGCGIARRLERAPVGLGLVAARDRVLERRHGEAEDGERRAARTAPPRAAPSRRAAASDEPGSKKPGIVISAVPADALPDVAARDVPELVGGDDADLSGRDSGRRGACPRGRRAPRGRFPPTSRSPAVVCSLAFSIATGRAADRPPCARAARIWAASFVWCGVRSPIVMQVREHQHQDERDGREERARPASHHAAREPPGERACRIVSTIVRPTTWPSSAGHWLERPLAVAQFREPVAPAPPEGDEPERQAQPPRRTSVATAPTMHAACRRGRAPRRRPGAARGGVSTTSAAMRTSSLATQSQRRSPSKRALRCRVAALQ